MEWQSKKAPCPTLFKLCGKSVEDTLVEIGNNFLSCGDISFDDYSKQIEGFTRQLFTTPLSRHSELAELCLKAANRLTYDLSGASVELVSRNQFVIQRLVAMATLFKPKKLDFRSFWPLVQESLLNFLWRMTNLEDFFWSAKEEQPRLTESLPFLTSVRKFISGSCTDEIIAAVCENCEHLKVVDPLHTSKMTDKSIDSLIQCKNLERAELCHTEITFAGLVKLLSKSQSKNLKSVGEDWSFSSNFLNLLKAEVVPFRPLPLTWFRGHDLSSKYLLLISNFFPHLQCLFLDYELTKLPDFSCLDCLEKLKAFEMCIRCRPKLIKQLYSLKSQHLTSLLISFESQISISGLIQIGVHCPNLLWLSLDKCSLIRDVDDSTECTLQKPFQKVETFGFHSNFTASGLDSILKHTMAIKNISLTASSGLTDAFLTSILKFNDLKELKSLRISFENNISLKLLKSLIVNCKKLKDLGYFETSVDASNDKFKCLQKFIADNKYSVKLCRHVDFGQRL